MKPPFTLLPSVPFLLPSYPHRQSPSLPNPTPSKPSTRSPRSQPMFLTASLFSVKSIRSSHYPCQLRKLGKPSSLFSLPATTRTSPTTGALPESRSLSHRTAVNSPQPTLRPDYLKTRCREGPRNPRMKTRPPTTQKRPTPSWQPPPPQRPRSLSILFLFSESNLPHVSSQNPRSAGHLPAPSLRYVAPAPGPTQGRTIRRAWGRTLVSHPLRNFNRFPRELLSPFTTEEAQASCRDPASGPNHT